MPPWIRPTWVKRLRLIHICSGTALAIILAVLNGMRVFRAVSLYDDVEPPSAYNNGVHLEGQMYYNQFRFYKKTRDTERVTTRVLSTAAWREDLCSVVPSRQDAEEADSEVQPIEGDQDTMEESSEQYACRKAQKLEEESRFIHHHLWTAVGCSILYLLFYLISYFRGEESISTILTFDRRVHIWELNYFSILRLMSGLFGTLAGGIYFSLEQKWQNIVSLVQLAGFWPYSWRSPEIADAGSLGITVPGWGDYSELSATLLCVAATHQCIIQCMMLICLPVGRLLGHSSAPIPAQDDETSLLHADTHDLSVP